MHHKRPFEPSSSSSSTHSHYDPKSDQVLQNFLALEQPNQEQLLTFALLGFSYSGITPEEAGYIHDHDLKEQKIPEWTSAEQLRPELAAFYLRSLAQTIKIKNLKTGRLTTLCLNILILLGENYKSNSFILFHAGIGSVLADSSHWLNKKLRKDLQDLALNQPEEFDKHLENESWDQIYFTFPAYLADFIAHRNLSPFSGQRDLTILIKYREVSDSNQQVIDDFLAERTIKPEILKSKLRNLNMSDLNYLLTVIRRLNAKIIETELTPREKIIWSLFNLQLHSWNKDIISIQQMNKVWEFYQDLQSSTNELERALLIPVLIKRLPTPDEHIQAEIIFFKNAYANKPSALSLLALTELKQVVEVPIFFEFKPEKINAAQLQLLQLFADDYPFISFSLGEYYWYQLKQLASMENQTPEERSNLGNLYSDKMKQYYLSAAIMGYEPAVKSYLEHYLVNPNIKLLGEKDRWENLAFFRFSRFYSVFNFTNYTYDVDHLEYVYHTKLGLANPPETYWLEILQKVTKNFTDFATTQPELLGELIESYQDSLEDVQALFPADTYKNLLLKRSTYLEKLIIKSSARAQLVGTQTNLIPELNAIISEYDHNHLKKDQTELEKLRLAYTKISPTEPLPTLQTPMTFFTSSSSDEVKSETREPNAKKLKISSAASCNRP